MENETLCCSHGELKKKFTFCKVVCVRESVCVCVCVCVNEGRERRSSEAKEKGSFDFNYLAKL